MDEHVTIISEMGVSGDTLAPSQGWVVMETGECGSTEAQIDTIQESDNLIGHLLEALNNVACISEVATPTLKSATYAGLGIGNGVGTT